MKRVAIVLALVWGGSCEAADFPFVQACEEALKARLVAPSTYRRIKLTEAREPITLDELLAGFDGENVKKLIRVAATRDPVRMVALVEYDATNAHGVPLRLTSRCTYETASDQSVDLDTARDLVRIDGKYNSQWRPEQAGSFTLRRRAD